MLKSYRQCLDYIYSRRKFAKSNGLERIQKLLSRLKNPQESMKFVHVVGTNGKGSTSTMISCVLKRQGLKVGLFTSPFVISFLERIRIDNSFVSTELFVQTTNEVKNAIGEIEKDGFCPTFFETVLAVAFLCFKKTECDIVILEAGIGGKDDSTNVIRAPLVSVFTSISLDHTDVLGNTIEKIATSKSGVIKNGSAVVSFPKNNCGFDFVAQKESAFEIIEKKCNEMSCNLVSPDMSIVSDFFENENGIKFNYKNLKIALSFFGEHRLANSCVAIEALFCLREKGIEISDESIEIGLKNSFIPCRMEVLNHKNKTVILDGGHNSGCLCALEKMLKKHFGSKKICGVFAFMSDKDYARSLEIIAPLCDELIFTNVDALRGASPDSLAKEALKFQKNVSISKNAVEAFENALQKHETVLVAGSFYLVSTIRNYITESTRKGD